MPKNRKHAIKKTKDPNRFTITERTVLFGGLIMLALLLLAVITFSLWQHYTIQPQKRRLDATAEDLKAVHDELVKTLPNVKSEGFEKSCGQASSVGAGTITCGSWAHVLQDNADNLNLLSYRKQVKIILEKNHFIFVEYKDLKSKFDETQLDESTMKSRYHVSCTLYEQLYNNVSDYNSDRLTNYDYSGKVYLVNAYCNEVTPKFFEGYLKR